MNTKCSAAVLGATWMALSPVQPWRKVITSCLQIVQGSWGHGIMVDCRTPSESPEKRPSGQI